MIVGIGIPTFAGTSDSQYELVANSVRSALTVQSAKVAGAIKNVPDEARKSSLGGLAAFVALKKEAAEAQRIRTILADVEKARLLHRDLPLAAIDIAISNSADRQSAAIAARNDLSMAKIATELAQLTALQRGIPLIPNERVVSRMPAAVPAVELAPLPVVDRIYQPRTPIKVREVPFAAPADQPTHGSGTVR
ncbi:hypothetical protein BH10BDE1_BH10BDE1_21310 [soil metagenome]